METIIDDMAMVALGMIILLSLTICSSITWSLVVGAYKAFSKNKTSNGR